MMPGETHSKTAGIASEAAESCQNCTSLQQNLNEYVAALIALKQKIIDSDHLLAEYQQKCDDLQYAERENETLRCQLEQMLQKISPQEQNEDVLKSLRAELEEKTSTLKIYQQTQQEYVKVKEECERSEMSKKKLEAKLKKIEEAAAKHVKDVKQLQLEKKVIGKELKKIQKKLDGFQNEKSKKAVKNAQTQVGIEKPVVTLDKRKIKFLLEELWGCIDSSTEKSDTEHLMFDEQLQMFTEVKAREKTRVRKERRSKHIAECTQLPSHGSPQKSQKFDPVLELTHVQASHDPTKCTKSKETAAPERTAAGCNGDSAFYEDTTTDLFVPSHLSDINSVNSDLENDMEEVREIINLTKPLPRLLSPLELSPLTTKQVFGEFTDSSDAESCDGMSEIVTNSTMDFAALDNSLCVQDQTISVSHVQAGDVLEKPTKQYNNLNKEIDNITVATDNLPSNTTLCPTSNDVLGIDIEMETSRQDIGQSALQTEISFGLVTNTLPVLKEDTTEHNHMEYGDVSHYAANRIDSSEEPSLLQSNQDLPEEKLDLMHVPFSEESTAKITDVPNGDISPDAKNEPGDVAEKLENDKMQCTEDDSCSTTNLTVNCSPSKDLIKPDDSKDSSLNGTKFHTLTSNDHESIGCSFDDNSPRDGDLLVHSSLTADKNVVISMDRSRITIPDCAQESLSPIHTDKCSSENSNLLNIVNAHQKLTGDIFQSHFEDRIGANCKRSEHYFKKVYSGNSASIDSTREDNLDQVDNLPVLHSTTKHTEEPMQHVTQNENNDPEFILKAPEQIQSSVSLGQGTPFLCNSDHHLPAVGNSDALDSNCVDIKEVKSIPIKEILLEVDINTVDKQSILNNKESMSFAPELLKYERKEDYDLEKCSSQKERPLETKCDSQMCLNLKLHETANASIFLSVDEQCKITSPKDVELPSSITGSHKLPVYPVDRKTALTEGQADTPDVDSTCSANLVACVDVDLCSSVCNQPSPPASLHMNNKCNSDIQTTKVDCVEKPVCHDISMSPVANHRCIQIAEDSVTKDNAKEDFLNKVCCRGDTPNKESCIELDPVVLKDKSAVHCLLSNTNLFPMKENQSKVMPVVPLEELQHLDIPSESIMGLKITEKTADMRDNFLDDSDTEDDFVIRRVSYSRTTSSNPAMIKSYKTISDDTEKNSGNGHLRIDNPQCKRGVPALAHDESRGQVFTEVPQNDSTSIEMENDISLESEHSVSGKITVYTKNDPSTEENTVEHYSDENRKELSPALASDCFQSNINNTEKNIDNSVKTECRRTAPGKNLIWNFSMPDDFSDPRAASVTLRPKAKSERVCGGSENLSVRAGVNAEKTPEVVDTSNKSNQTGFDEQTVRRENNTHTLSRGGSVSQNMQVGQTVLANADTSTNTDNSPETINKVRSEMGPPLPPLLGPLLATPPRSLRPFSPIMSSSSRSSLPSPLDDLISPLPGTPFPPLMSPLCDGRKRKSPVFTTPSPVEKANRRILSSPLQFCSATPKHALPVPGRLPLSATGNSAPNVQENSVKILDTMYPELSARARTLNILKGNVQLNRSLPGDGKSVPVSQITGFKPITSTSTAFIKTGSNSKTDNGKDKLSSCESQQPLSSCASVNKRASISFPMPKSAKRLRLDSESPVAESIKDSFTAPAKKNLEAQKLDESCQNISYCELLPDIVKDSSVDDDIITNALKKVEDLCFDLLPVIRSHVHVGTIPKVPVMRNEEKEVIYEFSSSKKGLADRFLHVILKKMKSGKKSMDSANLQALCRVYVGLCRQLGDIERARVLCFCILKEDFPDPDRLLLFIISSWNDIFSLHGVVSKAIQAVLKSLTKDEVGPCLSAYLNWQKTPPMNVNVILSSVLMAIQLYPDVKFNQSETYGEDLTDSIWEYVFAVDLLCNHCKWIWTHDHIISKELWPILDKWVKRKKGNPTMPFVPDIIVATVLRLVGHLSQMGLKEGYVTAVKNIASVILAFIQHANEEGMPWGVQLASVYMLCDLAPSDPVAIHQTLQKWKESAKNNIPPAVASCMQEVASLCIQEK